MLTSKEPQRVGGTCSGVKGGGDPAFLDLEGNRRSHLDLLFAPRSGITLNSTLETGMPAVEPRSACARQKPSQLYSQSSPSLFHYNPPQGHTVTSDSRLSPEKYPVS